MGVGASFRRAKPITAPREAPPVVLHSWRANHLDPIATLTSYLPSEGIRDTDTGPQLVVASRLASAIHVLDACTGEWLHTLAGDMGASRCLMVYDTGEGEGRPRPMIAVGHHCGYLSLWSGDAYTLVQAVKGHRGGVQCLWAYPPLEGEGGQRVVSGGTDANVKVWDGDTGDLLRSVEVFEGPIQALAGYCVWGSEGERWRLVAGDASGSLGVLDPESGEVLHWLHGHQWSINAIAYFESTPATGEAPRPVLLSGSGDRTAKLWDPESGAMLRR
jgi:WD40 repeat protein